MHIRLIPHDVLKEIFSLTEEGGAANEYLWKDTCKLFREVFLSTPAFVKKYRSKAVVIKYLSILKKQLERILFPWKQFALLKLARSHQLIESDSEEVQTLEFLFRQKDEEFLLYVMRQFQREVIFLMHLHHQILRRDYSVYGPSIIQEIQQQTPNQLCSFIKIFSKIDTPLSIYIFAHWLHLLPTKQIIREFKVNRQFQLRLLNQKHICIAEVVRKCLTEDNPRLLFVLISDAPLMEKLFQTMASYSVEERLWYIEHNGTLLPLSRISDHLRLKGISVNSKYHEQEINVKLHKRFYQLKWPDK
jgi:hypothetical protein